MRILKKTLWPYMVTVNSDNWSDITPVEEWLAEQVGAFHYQWNVVYNFNRTDFYFKNNQDATFFALRWT